MLIVRIGQLLFGSAAAMTTALAIWLLLKRNDQAPLFVITGGALIVLTVLTTLSTGWMLAGAAILLTVAGVGLLLTAAHITSDGRPRHLDDLGESTASRRH